MNLFRSLVFSALLAGALTGIFASALHLTTTVPLILKAEVYENTEAAGHHDAEHEHAADHQDVAPSALNRNSRTVVAMVLAYVGFALLMNASGEFSGGLATWKSGILWGAAGFLVFSLAPALGLPPELPGMPAADLGSRQVWWIGTAVMTAAAIATVYLSVGKTKWLIAAALVTTPFLVGAPHLENVSTKIPSALHLQFVITTLLVSCASWLLLGAILGHLRSGRTPYHHRSMSSIRSDTV
ncbi:CbtA family protein [Rhizobium leguminosarum]|uniref:CbtA family protein n=1 Tax=Rhizobium leguminosarum TaxID=384 RepID=UPI00102FED07|nr:CbtA family protein [Rhizobium leguminosarum]TBF82647.1 cobalt transporter subunit CbtA [Rhizobium leguminosarum]TBH02131.1 cobalt transporter subunit CbtA [Rhizobium leguminosarum]TBH36589.1 cobalt transporter subunit CbtA [Rhizobium leguminosarum]TBH41791.1 cobalt transporter subunit CbtA [Rhizobium leguminosarum]TBH66817.1 cobalt transporter subunit CbtA [Rhizobium leguminosarum]